MFVERARGIYSFSHLTFHEYFTARKVKEAGNDKLLHTLTTHIAETRWREVFLLTVGMLDNADLLLQLMKQQIDKLLGDDEKLQQYLTWVEEKSKSVEAPYKPAAVRAYYFERDRDINIDFFLTLALDQNLTFIEVERPYLSQDFSRYLILTITLDHDDYLRRKMQQLNNELPDLISDFDFYPYQKWWEENGENWIKQFMAIRTEHYNIAQCWKFNRSQKRLLEEYYHANKLLVECLNSDCYVSRDVRKYIEDTLILPIKSIPPARF